MRAKLELVDCERPSVRAAKLEAHIEVMTAVLKKDEERESAAEVQRQAEAQSPHIPCRACNDTGKVNGRRCAVCHGEPITYHRVENLINLNVPEPYRQPQLDLSMVLRWPVRVRLGSFRGAPVRSAAGKDHTPRLQP